MRAAVQNDMELHVVQLRAHRPCPLSPKSTPTLPPLFHGPESLTARTALSSNASRGAK